jgi:putative hydrolase of the HAD superfamily
MLKTLIPFDFTLGYAAMSRYSGIAIEEIRNRARSTDLVARFESGLVEEGDFIRQYTAQIGIDIPATDFRRIWNSIFFPETILPEQMIAALRKKYRMVLLSNTNSIHIAMAMREYPILSHFDARILSNVVKAMKPDPRIYQAALAAAQCKPEECFYTDDIVAYTDAAKALGIDAVPFESRAQIERELSARGVRWE